MHRACRKCDAEVCDALRFRCVLVLHRVVATHDMSNATTMQLQRDCENFGVTDRLALVVNLALERDRVKAIARASTLPCACASRSTQATQRPPISDSTSSRHATLVETTN